MPSNLSGISFILGAGFGAVIALLFMILKRLKSIENRLRRCGHESGSDTSESPR